jgi:hypothetical protein
MTQRYFSPGEVEALIPRLSELMAGLMSAHVEVSALRERLDSERQRIATAGGSIVDRRAWRMDTERLEGATRELQRGLAEIARLGGVPKDLTLGLVDFPHRRRGAPVNLCWKYGEQAIRFWHGLDEGYAARKPL